MNRLLRNLVCLVPLLPCVGCGGFAEQKPPEEAPEMSTEEQQHMEQEIDEMREMYKQQ